MVLKRILLGILILLLVFSAVSFVVMKNFYDKNFPRYDTPKPGYLTFSDVPEYSPTMVSFQSGKNKLAGYIYGGEKDKGLVVIAPGRGGGAETFLPETIYFVDHGWRVFSFDYTGSFASEGKGTLGLPQSRLDLDSALDYIKNNDSLNKLPVMLYGHSWGGYAVASVLNDHQDISAVVSISGFNSPMGLLKEQLIDQLGFLGMIEYPFAWLYQTLLFGRDPFVTAVDGINRDDVPVLIIHGTDDEAIKYNGASIIARRNAIDDPNAVYKPITAENKNNHDRLFRSDEALAYIDQKNEEYRSVYNQYNGNIPDDVLKQFYAGVDHFRTSELDPQFMDTVNSFFETELPKP